MTINPEQLDVLKELLTIGSGRAAAVLNEMTSLHISLDVPMAEVCHPEQFTSAFGVGKQERLAVVYMPFRGSFSGRADLVFSSESAAKLVSVVTGEEGGPEELDAIRSATLNEVGNIVLNGVMGSMANVLSQPLEYSVPTFLDETPEELRRSVIRDAEAVVLARIHFSIQGHKIEGEVILLFEVGSFGALIAAIDSLLQVS